MQTNLELLIFIKVVLVKLSYSSDIFKISYHDLDSAVSSGHHTSLESVMSSSGCMAVTNLPSDFIMSVRNIKRSAPWCLQQKDYPQFYLPDGSQRRTFASSSDEPEEYPECIRDDSEIVAKHVDKVDVLMSRLITDIAGPENLLWKREEDQNIKNFSSTLYKVSITAEI